MMKDLVVLLLGLIYPSVIFGLDFLPERARHGQAQKIFDSINPPNGKQKIYTNNLLYFIFIYRFITQIDEFSKWKNIKFL